MYKTILLSFIALTTLTSCTQHVTANNVMLSGFWFGGITHDSVKIGVLLGEESINPVTVFVEDIEGTSRFTSESIEGISGIVRFGNLRPDTTYTYGITSLGILGSFTTLKPTPHSFSIVASSCASTGSTHEVFKAINEENPSLFLHLGDLFYEDIHLNDPRLFIAAYEKVFASKLQQKLLRHIPIAYTWDDHDYGPNNSGKDSPSREAAQESYRNTVPSYTLHDDQGIYQSFVVGRVLVILTDTRSFRDDYTLPNSLPKTMLGLKQKIWFKGQVQRVNNDPGIELVIWANSVPWIGSSDVDGDWVDSWWRYEQERRELANFFVQNKIDKKMIIVGGDAHMVAIDDGTNSNFSDNPTLRGPLVFQVGALDQTPSVKGGPYSHGAYPGGGQYGIIQITDHGTGEIPVTLTGIRVDPSNGDTTSLVSLNRTFVAFDYSDLTQKMFLPLMRQR